MSKLSSNESIGDFTHVVKLTYSDLADIVAGKNPFTGADLATSGQFPIAEKPAFGAVSLVQVAETVALAGATNITFDVGTTAADPDEYIDALDVDAMTAPVSNTGDAFTGGQFQAVDASNTAEPIILEVNGTASSLTAGEVVIGLKVLDLGRFA